MRVISSLIFLFTVPLVVFIASIFYGGISSSVLKQTLIQYNIYATITDEIKHSVQTSENGNAQDATTSLITSLLLQRVTPEYVQGKLEKLIDDTELWIEGKTNTPPILSFPEIAQNLTVLTDLQNVIQQLQQQTAAAPADVATATQIAEINKQIDMLK